MFKQYLALEKEQKEVNERLSTKYKSWIEASGRQAKAPTNLVTNERAAWDRLQASKETLRLQAESNVKRRLFAVICCGSQNNFRQDLKSA